MWCLVHRRSQGGQRGYAPPKILENVVILCFESFFSKQNSIIRLQSNILAPPKILGWLRHCLGRPLSHFPVRAASRTRLAILSWVILRT